MNGRLEHDVKREQKIANALSRMPEFMAEWDENMKACRKSTVTRYQYLMKVELYLKSIDKPESEISLEDLTFQSAQSFFVSLKTTTKKGQIVESSDSQKCTMWSAMHSMFTYFKKRNRITENPMELIDRPVDHNKKRMQEKGKLLTANDFRRILDAVDNDIFSEVRERNIAILLLFMSTGMRKTALTEINIEDVNLDTATLSVTDNKKKTHVYYLTNTAYDAISDWMDVRGQFVTEESGDALFITKFGNRIGTDAIDDVVARYTKEALGKSLTPQKLRAGYINVLYEKTNDLDFVSKAVGHSDVAITARYVDTTGDDLQKVRDIMGDILD